MELISLSDDFFGKYLRSMVCDKNYDSCVKLPTGEVACSWEDVERASFLEIYTRRILMVLVASRKHTIIDYLLLHYRVRNLYENIQIHSQWISLITDDTLSWKEQKRLAQNTHLCEFEQYGIMYQAEKIGYLFSEYHEKLFPKDVQREELPPLIYQDNSNITHVVGNSKYEAKYLKMAMMDNSNTIYAQVITRGDSWHCFFSASKGIKGKESGKKPHIHYVSNKLGLPLHQVIQDILSNQYKGDKAHINNYTLDIPKYLRNKSDRL